ncbi:DNA mismatch repair protein msh6 [Phtheirospermum japonicum]|uniref:DNA mismatch repair protein msh6 n=1 Tax=Phtheirospermum japonicum TaxID=374723 RepID=A0A830DJ77_9LAMI|nr:DNA mismatch repair protein msh6 [Phtheirospermum japonicum]
METIMTLVLEESEDISPDLLNPILATLKMNNEAVMPIAKKLAERVIQNSADRLRPYLAQVVKSLDASLDDYGEVVASVCRENTDTVGNSNESVSRDEPVAEDGREETNSQEKEYPTLIGSSKSIVGNGIETEDILNEANFSKKADSNCQVDAKPMPKTESDDCGARNPVKLEAKAGHSEAQEVADNHEVSTEDVPTSPTEAKPVEAAESLDKVEDTTTQLSPPRAPENEATDVVSQSQSGSLCDESPSNKDSLAKRTEDLVREEIVSVDTASKKASEGESISKVKNQKGKTQSDETTDKDKASKNDEGSTSDSEARSLHQAEKLGDVASKKASKGESISKAKKQQHDEDNASDSEARSLSQTRKLGDAASKKASKGESISKAKKQQHDEDNASDSEARSLSQTRKLGDAVSKKASKGESVSKAKKQHQKGKKRPDETTGKDKALTGASKNDEVYTSDSEARSLKQTRNLGDAASKKAASKGESTSKAKKQQQKGKKQSEETTNKDKKLTEESASKNGEDNSSDSETGSLKHTEKLGAAASRKTSKGGSISKSKKQQQKGKRRPDETTGKDNALTEGAAKNDEGSTSDSEAKSLVHTEDLGDASNKTEDGSSMTKEDGKKSGRVKPTLGKDALKSSAREVRAKDKVTSPRSPLKSLKDEDIQEDTPRMSSKRKRTPGTEKASDTIEYGKNLVGSKVKVWWPKDRMFYEGEIASFDSAKKKHKVVYVDGDEEVLNLKRERWQFVGDALVSEGDDDDVEHSSHDTSPDVQRKKKGNANAETSKSKRQKMDGSSKSKQKDTATKSGGKSKDDGKQESEMKENNSKPSRKSVDDDDDDGDAIKPRDHSHKVGGKSQGGGKSKDDSAKTPSQQPKQDSQKNAKSKGKTPQSGKSVGAGGGTKTTKTSSSSKVKETERKKEKVADLDNTAKSRESETKSVGKKRRR